MQYDRIIDTSNKIIRYESDVRGMTRMATQHYHDIFEIYFLEYGECNYFIDDSSYEVKAGDIILIPKGTIHKTMYGEGVHSRKLIYCWMLMEAETSTSCVNWIRNRSTKGRLMKRAKATPSRKNSEPASSEAMMKKRSFFLRPGLQKA